MLDARPTEPSATSPHDEPRREPLGRDVGREERLRLLAWVGAPERHTYLAILEAFEAAQARYAVQLRPQDIVALPGANGGPVDQDGAVRYLDQLVAWGVLERAWDSALVASIEEYRRRRPVYRFSELGERAYRGVRELLEATPGEGRLQGFVLRSIADDLAALHDAVDLDDGQTALVLLNRIDVVVRQLAERAAQFYVLVGALAQEADVRAERFVELKDLLLGHLYGFLDELGRWAPVIAGHIRRLQAQGPQAQGPQGAERLIELVADADDAVFLDIEQRRVAWGQRWDGLVAWFAAVDGRSRVAELDRRTTTAVRELTGLLRRLMEVRGRGASRATDMVELARWFWGLHERPDGTVAAHALFDVCFGLGGSRHLARTLDEPDDHPPSTPWVDGPRVLVPSSLRDRGRVPSPGSTAAVPDDRRDRERMRRREQHLLDAEQTATRSLAAGALGTRVLSAAELGALLRLVDLALVAGVPVAGEVAVATMGPVHVRVTAAESDCIVQAETGVLRLRGVEVTVAGR